MRYVAIVLSLSAVLGGCAVEPAENAGPAVNHAAVEEAVSGFFRAMEGWDFDALRATVTSDFELVEDTVIMTMDDFVAFIQPLEAQDGQMRWTCQNSTRSPTVTSPGRGTSTVQS